MSASFHLRSKGGDGVLKGQGEAEENEESRCHRQKRRRLFREAIGRDFRRPKSKLGSEGQEDV